MQGRKLSTVAIVGALATVAMIGGCRDDATTGPSNTPSTNFANGLRVLAGDQQTGAVGVPLASVLRVRVVDAGGSPVQGANVTWSVLAGGGFVTPPTGVSDVNGQVTTSWTLGPDLGTNSVRAYLVNGFLLDSVTFGATATAGAPAVIEIDENAPEVPSTQRVASVVPVTFLVSDQFNHPVAGATVTFAPGFNSGTVAPTTVLTDNQGRAEADWTLGTITGPQTLSASIPGQAPLVVSTTATPDTSRRLAVSAGNNQAAATGTLLPLQIQVQVTDRFGNAVAGEPITFSDSVTAGDVVTSAAPVSDATGFASATWRLSERVGVHNVRVRIVGNQFARFTATAQVAYRDVFAGNGYTCAVSTAGKAYCWGFGEDGQLGNNANVSRNAPLWPVTRTDSIAGPFPTFRDVSGAEGHACGVGTTRTLFCWGFNPDGRHFVTPPTGRVLVAVDVSLVAVTNNPQLASTRFAGAGESFSCAVTMGGIALCSGNNESGQSGSGLPAVTVPTTRVDTVNQGVAPPFPIPTHYSFIAVGERHACGMPRFDAAVATSQVPWCWGRNNDGQLGLGTVADTARPAIVSMPVGVTAFDSTSLVTGAQHTCALTPTGAAYCWGSNAFGQLGSGGATGTGARSSVAVPVVGGVFARLYAGEHHTCGLTSGGQAFCWGRNNAGQLGDGTTTNSAVPVAVGGGRTFGSLTMGEFHSCGIAGTGPVAVGTLGPPGELLCWGQNEFGQLGLGTFGLPGAPVLTPTRVLFQP